MEYRQLGASGLRVSALSYGSWLSFADEAASRAFRDSLAVAREAGITLFDTAETYAGGRAERVLGAAIADLGWDRSTYILSTKLYWGLSDWPHLRRTLNRKYLMQGIDGCLERLGTPFVDVLLCHRRDPTTPIEEVVWAMSDIVASGRALYWGTSEWTARDVQQAWSFAEQHGLRKPVVEQPEYNLFARERVEREYAVLTGELGLGLMTWSPLASGLLTGKYANGIPPGSRGGLPGNQWLLKTLVDPDRNARVATLARLAHELGCRASDLAIAWCTANPQVSSVILGASGPDQLRANLRALEVAARLDEETVERINRIFA